MVFHLVSNQFNNTTRIDLVGYICFNYTIRCLNDTTLDLYVYILCEYINE